MKKHIDYYFLGLALALIISGLLFLALLSAQESLKFFGNTTYYIFHQLIAAAVGVVAALIILKLPLSFIKKVAPILLIANLILASLVFLPFLGIKFWGAQRWISVWGVTFQPSEFLKLTSILYLSALLSKRVSQTSQKGLGNLVKRGLSHLTHVFLPFVLLVAAVVCVLYFQKDLSTMGITIAALTMIYFVSGTNLWHTIATGVTAFLGGSLFILLEPYRIERFKTLLFSEADPLGIGMQLKQSLIAVGSGGIFGKGLGMSSQKFGFLPQAMSDSVFAIVGEEVGLVGCLIVVVLFLLLAWQIFKIAKRSHDSFSALAATGIGSWIFLQAFINMASSLGMFPLSGVPLPFFSYGGSHLIAEIIAMGLVLKFSKDA